MIEYFGNIENFWSNDLASHTYVKTVPLSSCSNLSHVDTKYYQSGALYQSFNDELPNAKMFCSALGVTNDASVSWTDIQPNLILPTHRDTFYTLRTKNNVDVDKCYRYLIFLEDYVFGQYVGFETKSITDWKNGDVWMFDSTEMHFAVNASNSSLHTCQVSTFK